MRALYVAISVLALAVAAMPEIPRYAAERRLYRATAVLQLVFARPQDVPSPAQALAWAVSTASDAAASLPGDWRPLNVAGSALFVARRPEQALETYRRALALGERPEIDLNLGRAHASLGRDEQARAAFLRAGWVSPPALAWLPRSTQDALRPELDALEVKLRRGTLAAPPPRPD